MWYVFNHLFLFINFLVKERKSKNKIFCLNLKVKSDYVGLDVASGSSSLKYVKEVFGGVNGDIM